MYQVVTCKQTGDPTLPLGAGVLELQQVPRQPLPKGHVRLKVQAASINYADPLSIKGEYQVKFPLGFTPGAEASGTVVEVGQGVINLQLGDQVTAFYQGGGAFAEEWVVPEGVAWKVPEGVSLEDAAAVPVVYGTADVSLRHRAKLQPGQTVLVLGAGGGVGMASVQIAKAVGAQVVAVTQGSEKVAFVQQQGADAVVDLAQVTQDHPLHKAVKLLAPKGVDVVIDPVGGPYLLEALKTVAWGAHVVVIGFAAGSIPKVPANILLVKNTTLHGVYWGSYLMHDPQVLKESMHDIMQWLASGALKPSISHRFPLQQTPEAMRALLQRQVQGKVLLVPGLANVSKL